MNKTLKRRVFRHTALYAAILMFSHTGGGGGGGGAKPKKTPFIKKRERNPGKNQKVHLQQKKKKRNAK
ncbi:hypothetical protein M5Z93_03060 [Neisseria meningitidis]|nr:hypothetical protein [Neisseria meningitidis]